MLVDCEIFIVMNMYGYPMLKDWVVHPVCYHPMKTVCAAPLTNSDAILL